MRAWKLVVATTAVGLVASGCTTVVRSSVGSNGAPPDQHSFETAKRSISDDGRYVAFSSSATTHVANDTNGVIDVFRRDNQSGTTVRVSVSVAGAQLAAPSQVAAISGDGDHVLFLTTSAAEPGDTNTGYDYYVHTISSGTSERASLRPDGSDIPFGTSLVLNVSSPTISDDGRFVLMRDVVVGTSTFFLRDLVANTTRSLGTAYGVAMLSGNGAFIAAQPYCVDSVCPRAVIAPVSTLESEVIDPVCARFTVRDISADGRYIVGDRRGVEAGCNVLGALARWDRTTKQFVEFEGYERPEAVSISNDGRFVTYVDDDGALRVQDLATGESRPQERDVFEQPAGDAGSFGHTLSGNGRYIAFVTGSKLVAGDTDAGDDVYTRFTIQPSVTSAAPSTLARGANHAIVTVTGTELLSGVAATFGAGITVHSTTLLSPTTLQADVSVSPTATVGKRDVQVQNSGGFGQSSGFCFGCLTVS